MAELVDARDLKSVPIFSYLYELISFYCILSLQNIRDNSIVLHGTKRDLQNILEAL